jgi:hypothetical protein
VITTGWPLSTASSRLESWALASATVTYLMPLAI